VKRTAKLKPEKMTDEDIRAVREAMEQVKAAMDGGADTGASDDKSAF